MNNTLYTYGYAGGGTLADLQAHTLAGALVVDVRFRPNSRQPLWRSHSLERSLAPLYTHCYALGNRRYRDGPPVELVAPEVGLDCLERYLAESPVVLLCGCREPEGCHRSAICDLFRRRHPQQIVRHLAHGERIPQP